MSTSPTGLDPDTFCKKRNQQYLLQYLLENPCVDCGEDDVVVLEFDHVQSGKCANVGALAQRCSLARLQEEIDKCEVRCANCHRRATYQRMSYCWRTDPTLLQPLKRATPPPRGEGHYNNRYSDRECRQVFILHGWGWSYARIGHEMGMSRTYVRQLILGLVRADLQTVKAVPPS